MRKNPQGQRPPSNVPAAAVNRVIERELQALPLDGDVSVFGQHILDSLRAAYPASVNWSGLTWLYSFAISTALRAYFPMQNLHVGSITWRSCVRR